MSDAEALAAAQAASQSQQGRDSTPSSPERAQQGSDEAQAKADALGNEQMVWEMLYNPDYSLPTADAVAAWHRAMGKEVEEEEVRLVRVLVTWLTCACREQLRPCIVNNAILCHKRHFYALHCVKCKAYPHVCMCGYQSYRATMVTKDMLCWGWRRSMPAMWSP
jgi:hypothetical protein